MKKINVSCSETCANFLMNSKLGSQINFNISLSDYKFLSNEFEFINFINSNTFSVVFLSEKAENDFIINDNLFFRFISTFLIEFKANKRFNVELLSINNNGWSSIDEVFKIANLRNEYVILRNWEKLNSEDDIDILCVNKLKMINDLHLSKRSWGESSFQVKVNKTFIPVDLRYLGDNYYDSSWQYDLLSSKILWNHKYVLDEENYFYSYLYHIIFHKKYITRKNYSNLLDIKKLTRKNYDIDTLINLLQDFMKKNNYSVVDPFDQSMKLNKKYFEGFNFLSKNKIPLKDYIYMNTPLFLRKFYTGLKMFVKGK